MTSLQSSLQILLGTSNSRRLRDGKALSSSFIFMNERRLLSLWKSLNLPIKVHSDVQRGRIFISACDTFETKSLVRNQDGKKDSNNSQVESVNKDSEEMDERERLRRMKISKANKGKMPWNKGRKHSPITVRRISERTRIAMQSPKIKEKLMWIRKPLSDEVKEKIGAGARKCWQRRLKMLALQKYCLFEWQNLIAEASRTGYAGMDELQWDSKKILEEQLQKEWLESVERRKSARSPKYLKQRRKLLRESLGEAEKAAKALELAVENRPIAGASLEEIKKLIAQTIKSIDALETRMISTSEMHDQEPSDASVEEGSDELVNHAERANINDTRSLASTYGEDSDYGKVSVNDEEIHMKQPDTSSLEQQSFETQ